MRIHDIAKTLAGAIFLLAAACGAPDAPAPGADTPVVAFDTATARLEGARDTVTITIELAATTRQKIHGLMERDHLPERHGMLFIYDEPQDPESTFYMYRTRIPLDIAFIGADGRIDRIVAMDPCPYPNPRLCPHYAAGVPFVKALEVSRGFFERHAIGVGDRLELP